MRACSVLLSTLLPASLALAQEGYEGGKGLLTLEGPSGMFINPTSATMPAGFGTGQYCVFFPNNRTTVVGHGLMGSYGLTDSLEVGAAGNYIDKPGEDILGGGPFVRWRLRQDEAGGLPQVSLGGYTRVTDDIFPDGGEGKGTVFLAAYKRLPIAPEGFVQAVGFHAGARQSWLDSEGEDSLLAGYGGVEVQLPLRCYVVGEVTTKDDDFNAHTPYAYGVQWRAAGIAMSFAAIQNGGVDDVSFFYGVGFGSKL
jgi:hypothetical protein